MEFLVLGPLEVWINGLRLNVGPPKQRAVLAVLLLAACQTVSVRQLIDQLWGATPPHTANVMLQTYISKLRRLLDSRTAGGDGQRPVLVTDRPGYRLVVEPDQVDLCRFDQLVAAGRKALAADDPEQAAARLGMALALWRGPALSDVASEYVHQTVAARLEEARLAALEDRVEADLRCGRHHQVIGELRELTAAHPLRERLHGRLMLALYRCNRQAEALEAYQRASRLLADELGADPGAELQRLHLEILRHEVEVEPNRPETARETTAAARPWAVQYQLPPDTAGFVGRDAIVERVIATVRETSQSPPIIGICGPPGVGKTALAVHVAHRLREHFPGGAWYARLDAADGTARDPGVVLAELLQTSGAATVALPDEAETRAATFRARVADRRVLLLLDNASGAAQVRLLLPGTPGSAVLVTSRTDLSGLTARYGSPTFRLDVLTSAESRQLLAYQIGRDRVDKEPDAVDEVVELCDGLPLALRTAGAKLASQPATPIHAYAGALRTDDRLTELEVGGDDQAGIRAAFALSYRGLPDGARRLFRLLGLLHGPVSTPAAAALLGDGTQEAARLLRTLTVANLLERISRNRYQLHDLLRLYARELIEAEDPKAEREAALQRLSELPRLGVPQRRGRPVSRPGPAGPDLAGSTY